MNITLVYLASQLPSKLSTLDIENLACGRVTRAAMNLAIKTAAEHCAFNPADLGREVDSFSDMLIADALNDLFEAGKFIIWRRTNAESGKVDRKDRSGEPETSKEVSGVEPPIGKEGRGKKKGSASHPRRGKKG